MDLKRISELGFENVSLWNSLVLLVSFSGTWSFIIALQCFLAFFVCSANFALQLDVPLYITYTMDLLYLLEVTFTLLYVRNKRLRKLKYCKIRHWIFIIVDLITLIPVELIFTFHYISVKRNPFLCGLLSQNRSLRIYRIFLIEIYYMVTVRTTLKYILLTFILLFTKSFIIAHVLTCVWFNVDKKVACDPQKFTCLLWYEVNMLNVVLSSWRGPPKTLTNHTENVITLCCMISGFFLIFAYIYPYTFYFSLLLGCKDSLRVERRKRVQKFLENKIEEQDLKMKILSYFNYVWSEGENELHFQSLFSNIPLAMKKEIFSDIYWEAFRHSHLLRETSRCFKRALSLVMTTEYYHDGEVVLFRGQEKRKMIFVVQGVLQLMAEENEQSPLISFSIGTIFGEFSLFFFTSSHAIVKCKGYCELQILRYRGLVSTLMDYPKDKKLIFDKIHQRLLMAKAAQWRKKAFKEDQKLDMLSIGMSYFTVEDCVKWLKTQWRNSWEIHKRHKDVLKAKAEGVRLPPWSIPVRPSIKIEFISNYLDLIVLSNVFEEKKDAVCLHTKFPWAINPSSQFLLMWNYVILVTSFIPALLYPVCTSWFTRFPQSVYVLSYVVTLIFLIDVGLKFMTAVKTKHKILTKWVDILRYNLRHVTFYLDIIAALPYQLFILSSLDVFTVAAYRVGLVLHPAILKSYVFICINPQPGNFMDVITVFKNAFLYLLFLYWFSEFIQLLHIVRILDRKHKSEWIQRYLRLERSEHINSTFLKEHLLSVFRAFTISLGIPTRIMYADSDLDLVFSCLARYFFTLFFCYFLGSCYSSIAVTRFGAESFQILLQRLNKFLAAKNVPKEIVSKIVKCIQFQWIYDKADYVSGEVSILNSLPWGLRRQVYLETTYKTLASTHLFNGEPVEFLVELLENSECVAVPPGSMVVTFGHTSHVLTIINKGYCQMNSHLITDIASNIGRPLILGPGRIFPLLSSFCNVPSPISVVTITDCELILIHLNTMISIMMKYNIFKDVLDVIMDLKLGEKLLAARPALVKIVTKTPNQKKDGCKENFGLFKKFCYTKLKKERDIFTNEAVMKYWEFFFTFYNLLECVLWPCSFGLLLFHSHIILPILGVGKIIIVMHICIHVFAPYFNKMGLRVTHPLHTFTNYLTSSFALHLFQSIPVFQVYYYLIFEGYQKPNYFVLVLSTLQVFLGLPNVVGCIGYIGSIFGEIYYTAVVKLIVTLLLLFNLYVNSLMCFQSNWEFGGPRRIIGFNLDKSHELTEKDFLRKNKLQDYYLLLTYWLTATMTSAESIADSFSLEQLFLSYMHAVLGIIVTFIIFVTVSSVSKFTNIRAITFQEQFNSFMKYLKYEKADAKTIKNVCIFYNYLWAKTQGEDIKEIFGLLPLYLLEELWYPLYRPTFNKNGVFEDADEGFFRILATQVRSVFFTRGSLIIFKGETKSYIYIVHKGKCFVYDWFITLDMGSILGDIHRTGLMQNKVYALTHVEMLRIPSSEFFTILNNFDTLEATFLHTLSKAESFIKSDVYREDRQPRPVDSRDAVNAFNLKVKEIGFEDESHFEDPDNATMQAQFSFSYKAKEKRKWVIYPYSWKMKVYFVICFGDVVLTILLVPTFTIFGGVSVQAFITIGVLDCIWLIIIIASFLVGLEDYQKGDVITNYRFLAMNYIKKGFILDVLTLIPFELIPVAAAKSRKGANASAVIYLRAFRYLRAYRFFKHGGHHFGMLRTNYARNCVRIIVLFFWAVIVSASIFINLTTDSKINAVKNNYEFERGQFDALVVALSYVMNAITSADVTVILPTSRAELLHFIFLIITFTYIKARMISTVLSVIYFTNLNVSASKEQVSKLESYLRKKETSPILIKGATDYKTNLTRFTHSENMPSFLIKVPVTIRIQLMKNLFVSHLVNCPLFAGLENIFLDQLVARAKREVFFPGEKIVEQGDVDHRFYFIHTGEVYVINQTKKKAYVEHVIGRMYAGEFFGEAQGLWFSRPHRHTYRGRTLVETLVLYSKDWLDLRRAFPQTTRQIYENAKRLRYI